MRTIHILTTGGTIEKVYSEQSGTVVNDAYKIEQYLKSLRLPGCKVEVTSLMNKDSLEMTEEDRDALIFEVINLLPQKHPIVISHGTDTMVETGLYLKCKLPEIHVPIVLTGAMAPLGFERSDGLQNLTESLFATQLLNSGVFVVIHGQIFPVDQVRKDRTLGTFVAT